MSEPQRANPPAENVAVGSAAVRGSGRNVSLSQRLVPIEFAATVVGGQPATVDRDGFVGYLFGLAARADGSDGCLIVQRADDPKPEWQPYCLVWGEQEGTTYGGVCRADVADGEVTFELLRHNAAELGTPTRFRIVFPPGHTEEVRAGLRRTLGDSVVS